MFQVAIKTGLYDDLVKTFDNNLFKVNELLSLAIFPFISGKNYSGFSKWQKTHKTLLDYSLTSSQITRLTQSITDNDRMTLIQLRLKRQPKGSYVDCDSITKSAWGQCLADIRWGQNKDNPKLKSTVEVFIYSLSTKEPIYYRLFPGNISDMSTPRTIIADLNSLGIYDLIFLTDRGYASELNIATFVAADLPFIMCCKINLSILSDLLFSIKYNSNGSPINMEFSKERRLFFIQLSIEPFVAKLCDDTEVEITDLKANLF